MYIEPKALLVAVGILGVVALIYLIYTLKNINQLIQNANELLVINKSNITESISKVPNVIDNFNVAGENLKDVTEAVTDLTADIVIARDNVKSNVDILMELGSVFKNIFNK